MGCFVCKNKMEFKIDLMKIKNYCRLCGNKELKLIQKIPKIQIVNLYKKNFDIDISDEFEESEIDYVKCKQCSLYSFEPRIFGSPNFYEELQDIRKVYYSSDRNEFSFAKKFIKKQDKVLEIGAGYCFFADLIKVDDYTGLEFNDKAIIEGKRKGYEMLKTDISQFDKVSAKDFDIVCSFHVLEHVPDIKSFIESSLNVLKKDGKLIIAVPCNNSILTNNMNHVLNTPPHHLSRFMIETMDNLTNVFKLELLEFDLSFVSTIPSRQDYFIQHWAHRIFNWFSKDIKPFGEEKRIILLKRIIKKIFKVLSINDDKFGKNPIGENMTFVYRKL